MTNLILDTNIIKWLSSPYSNEKSVKASEIFQSICDGKHDGILIPPVIMETYYKLSESDDEPYAKAFINTLLSMPNLYVVVLTREIGMYAGELYFKYNTTPKIANPTFNAPGAVDCLLAATNNFVDNSIVCTGDGHFRRMTEITSDFFGISTI